MIGMIGFVLGIIVVFAGVGTIEGVPGSNGDLLLGSIVSIIGLLLILMGVGSMNDKGEL